jgi:hypothetical protein
LSSIDLGFFRYSRFTSQLYIIESSSQYGRCALLVNKDIFDGFRFLSQVMYGTESHFVISKGFSYDYCPAVPCYRSSINPEQRPLEAAHMNHLAWD